MIPGNVKPPTIPIPFHKLLKVVAIVDRANRPDQGVARPDRCGALRRRGDRPASTGTSPRTPTSAPTSRWWTATRLEAARKLAGAVRAIGFRTPLWALADSHRISDLAVVGGLGEVDGYIYLGQQSPAFYAKQVVASVIRYGMSLLPPFFGGLMAYDSEATIAFDCPGHQGGQFYRKSPAGTALLQALRREHLSQRPVQCRRGAGRSADPRGRRGRRATPRRAGVRRRPHLLRPERHQHLQQGGHRRGAAAGRPCAVRPQQPQVHAPGRPGPGRRDPGFPADGAQFLRHDRGCRLGRVGREVSARADPRESAGEGQRATQGRASVPPRMHPARHLRRHDLQRAQGAREDRASVRLRAVGRSLDRLQRVPSAVRGPQPDAHHQARAGDAGAVLHAIGAQAGRRVLAGVADPQARRAHPRPEALRRAQALQRVVPDARLHLAVLPAVRLARRERQSARGQGRRDAVGPLHRARYRGAQETARVRPPLRADRCERAGEMVLRSVRARRGDDPRLQVHHGRHRRARGRICPPT